MYLHVCIKKVFYFLLKWLKSFMALLLLGTWDKIGQLKKLFISVSVVAAASAAVVVVVTVLLFMFILVYKVWLTSSILPALCWLWKLFMRNGSCFFHLVTKRFWTKENVFTNFTQSQTKIKFLEQLMVLNSFKKIEKLKRNDMPVNLKGI